MSHRTCPHCQYKFSFWEYLKNPFFKGVYTEWKCLNCGTCLTTDVKRRWLISFTSIVPMGFAPQLSEYLQNLGIPAEYSWAMGLFLLSAWALFIFSFDRFELPERQKLHRRT